MNRRAWMFGATIAAAATRGVRAQQLVSLDVAYAGSMGSLMEGPVKQQAAQTLRIDFHGRGQGSDALAQLIVGGSITPDVFIPVTATSMNTVLKGGKATAAVPIARTSMVIAYSSKSKYAPQLADAAAHKRGAMPWWQILTQPDIRFGRTDPNTDPQGRNIIFTMQLAEALYQQPGLANKILGPTINPAQIFTEPTVQARIQSGELDAASAYKIQPGPLNNPYLSLPPEINLAEDSLQARYATATLELGGKTYHPEPLIYYASVMTGAAHPDAAHAFVAWLTGAGGQAVFKQFSYDPPRGAATLHA